jgi:hypothetical protein
MFTEISPDVCSKHQLCLGFQDFDYRPEQLWIAQVSTDYAVSPLVVRLAGIEPTTLGFGGQYSIH